MFSFKSGLKFLLLSTVLMMPNFAFAQNVPQASSNLADAEYYANWRLDMINAQPAYQKGFTGKGVVVAVVDSGLDVNHPEYAGRVSPLLYNFGIYQALEGHRNLNLHADTAQSSRFLLCGFQACDFTPHVGGGLSCG